MERIIKTVDIKFEYKKQVITLKAEPYNSLREIKEKALKSLVNLNPDIHCFYMGRDLTNYEKEKIGELFSQREKVTLKLMMPLKKNLTPIFGSNKEDSSKNCFSELYLNTNVYSIGFNNIGRINKSLHNKTNSYICMGRQNYEKFSSDKLPHIIKKTSLTKIPSDQEINSEERDNRVILNELCKCNKRKISEFCRTCKKFLCQECKNGFEHKKHLTIHLDLRNLENNLFIYGNILKADIKNYKNINNTLINKKKNKISLILQDFSAKQEEIIEKLQSLIQLYEKIIKQIKTQLYKEDQDKILEVFNTYNDKTEKISNEINQLLDKIRKASKLTPKKFITSIKEISKNEEKINQLNKDIYKYHLNNEINNKINSTFDKLNRCINDLCKENEPFGLDCKYNEELLKLLGLMDGEKNMIQKKETIEEWESSEDVDTEKEN